MPHMFDSLGVTKRQVAVGAAVLGVGCAIGFGTHLTYVDRALEIRPDDNIVLHMRGRWSFSVAQLSWIERKVAATLFASPPNATVEDALADFLEAERVKPGEWIENLVYVAKCYLALNDQTSAMPYLRTALSGLEVTDPGDQAALEEARLLMKSIT
uniref:Tetratricopeptide repeat protein n=1 Tax=Plectus sambesii TaxID=2011161 RepID=A0A914VZE6_9BILA